MADIKLCGITFEGRHGATAPEREVSRPFQVDVTLTCDTSSAERDDTLKDTIDYAQVGQIVVDIGTGTPRHLLEHVGRLMVDALADKFPQAAIELEIRKPNPPGCPGHADFAAVRLKQNPLKAL